MRLKNYLFQERLFVRLFFKFPIKKESFRKIREKQKIFSFSPQLQQF